MLQPALPKYRNPVFRELSRRPGIDFQLFFSNDEPVKNVEPDGFRATPIATRLLTRRPRLLWRKAHLDLVDPKRFDVIVAGWNTRYVSLIPCLLKAARLNVPVVLWGHGYSKRETFLKRSFRDFVANLATALIFYGHTGCKRFVARHGRPERAFVALNTLDQSEIQAARKKVLEAPGFLEEFKRKNGLDKGPVLLFVSRLVQDNRTDLLILAAKRLLPDFPDLRVVIVGGGEEEQHLRTVAKSAQVEQHTIFTGAIYEEAQLAPWFLSASLFVYPSNMGLSLLHAMGYGLPVITTDQSSTWAPELDGLKPWLNGMTFNHESVEDLAFVIRNMLQNPERLQRMRDSAYRTATREYSLKRMVDGLEAAIRYAHSTTRKS